ncbi:MAG: RsbRD N-terminal domain-containing protein [Nitrospirota bacterium]
MGLKEHLQENRSAIVNQWFETVVGTYQEETRGPLRRQNAPFTNPVGFNTLQGLEGLFEGLLKGMLPSDTSRFLDGIVRIRAVQDFPPSEALQFILQLKTVVRSKLGETAQEPAMAGELVSFESSIDDLALFAFDLYMQCRETIYDIKAKEARSMTFRLLQKAQLITENQE